MPIDPVKIPQNVYVEDRIIGPITLRQIMITMVSAGISYAIWAVMRQAGPVSAAQTTFAWMPAVIGALFAFIRINGISLFRIMLLVIEKLDKPSRRVWTPRTGIYVNIVTRPPKEKHDVHKQQDAPRDPTHIQKLSEVLDQGPQEDDDEEENKETGPVKRERISVEEMQHPVDDIGHFPAPPSHA